MTWVDRAEGWGAVPAGEQMRRALADFSGDLRTYAWEQASMVVDEARNAGCAGVVLTGVRFDTVVGDAAKWLRSIGLAPSSAGDAHHRH